RRAGGYRRGCVSCPCGAPAIGGCSGSMGRTSGPAVATADPAMKTIDIEYSIPETSSFDANSAARRAIPRSSTLTPRASQAAVHRLRLALVAGARSRPRSAGARPLLSLAFSQILTQRRGQALPALLRCPLPRRRQRRLAIALVGHVNHPRHPSSRER